MRDEEMKVLIVEDEPRLREVLRRAVREMGFTPAAARTGEEALRAMAEEASPILMVDLNLPGMGGLELLAAVRERWPASAAIVLTGFGDLEAAKRAIHLDVVDFLTKPCPLGEIEAALSRARLRVMPAKQTAAAVAEEPEAGTTMEEVERRSILAAIDRHRGNRTAAAAELGISVRKLYYRLAEYQRRGLMD